MQGGLLKACDPGDDSRVSLIATVLNEASSAEAWLRSVLRQTRPADEIVIVDAGSEDGTVARLHRIIELWHSRDVRIIVAPGLNISEGRNRAIAESGGEIIASSDAGTILDRHWLERLLVPFDDPDVDVVGGFYRPDGRNRFERLLAAVITPRQSEIDRTTFLPSSRSIAFRRRVWTQAGGYPEWLRVCEDVVFDLTLRTDGATFALALDALVAWFPAPTFRAYFRQWKRYARGDGHARLFGNRHAIRYAAYCAGGGLLLLSRTRNWPKVVMVSGAAGYLRRYMWRLWAHEPFNAIFDMVAASALVPGIVVAGDVAKMIGYPIGRWERWRAGGARELRQAPILPHRSLDELDDGGSTIPQRW